MGNVRRRKPSCTGSFTKNFRDNQWELSDRDKEKLKGNEDYIKFKTCIEKMEAAGNEIDKVIVSSSSSQLDNTNDLFPAKKKFCAKGFKELSKARTNSTLDVLKGEFSTGASGKTAQLTNILGDKNNNQIQLSFGGSNRNGTSGECPYALNANGDEVMKPEYRRGGKQRAELDKAKFTKVKIVFKPKYESLGSNGKNPCYKATVNCKKLTMQCIGGGIQPGWPKTK